MDRVRSAGARESIADASRAAHQLEALKDEQRENRFKLQHSIAELVKKLSSPNSIKLLRRMSSKR